MTKINSIANDYINDSNTYIDDMDNLERKIHTDLGLDNNKVALKLWFDLGMPKVTALTKDGSLNMNEVRITIVNMVSEEVITEEAMALAF